jgi:23S rRNA (guanosine2251-2'-O)-methyltransferase
LAATSELLSSSPKALKLLVTKSSLTDARVKSARDLARAQGVDFDEVDDSYLDKLTAGATHQGCVLVTPPFAYAYVQDVLRVVGGHQIAVALDGVTDPQNLGAIARSALAFGASGLVIPERRAAQVNATAWKASAGAFARLPVARVVNLSRAIEQANELGWQSIGLAAHAEWTIKRVSEHWRGSPILLVAGSEGDGLSRLVAEKCVQLARIPHEGETESLNVSVSVAIALYEMANRLD